MASRREQVAGIDVGARRLHYVRLDSGGGVAEAAVISVEQPAGLERMVAALAGVDVVAIDAPERPLSDPAPHAQDPAALSRKYRFARCAEIALGEERHVWVPWVTKRLEEAPAWMRVGFELFERVTAAGCRTIEVFPYAAFRLLATRSEPDPGEENRSGRIGWLPPKSTPEGLHRRVRLLRAVGAGHPGLEMWSHDGLDALMAAEIALDYLHGRAQPVPAQAHAGRCTYDGSAIWLPGARG